MLYLFLAIFLNVVLSVLFKLLPQFGIDTFQAVVTNYWVCLLMGLLLTGGSSISPQAFTSAWMPGALVTGLGFICIFTLIGWCTRVDGITTTITANKLSLIIPALFSLFLYRESAGIVKISGIILALPAVYLTTRATGDKKAGRNFLLPVLLFIGSGLLDTWIKFVQTHFIQSPADINLFSTSSFGIAGILGACWLLVLILRKQTVVTGRNLVAGVAIGIPNYFSIICLVHMLSSHFLQSSAMIPVLNMGIVLASSLTAILLFREPVNRIRVLGLLLAIVSIWLIASGDH